MHFGADDFLGTLFKENGHKTNGSSIETVDGNAVGYCPMIALRHRHALAACALLLATVLPVSSSSAGKGSIPPRAAAPSPPLPPDYERPDYTDTLHVGQIGLAQAKIILLKTNTFADASIGFVGSPSRQVQAFNIVLDQPDPIPILEELSRDARLPGRLYALCGFQVLDRARFERLSRVLRASDATVRTFGGCITSANWVREIVAHLDEDRTGKRFRDARARTYELFSQYDKPPRDRR